MGRLSAIESQAGDLTLNDTMVRKAPLFDETDILARLNCNFTRGFSALGMYGQLVICPARLLGIPCTKLVP
jgi:hypothetical protein